MTLPFEKNAIESPLTEISAGLTLYNCNHAAKLRRGCVALFFFFKEMLVLLLNQSIHIHFLCLLLLHCKGAPTSALVCGFGSIFLHIPATQTSNSRKRVLLL